MRGYQVARLRFHKSSVAMSHLIKGEFVKDLFLIVLGTGMITTLKIWILKKMDQTRIGPRDTVLLEEIPNDDSIL